MRILHAAFSALVSGSSRYICDLGARQMAAGHTVGVALPPRGEGVSIYELLPVGMDVLSVLGSPGYVGLARAVERFKPDVLHFHDGRGPRAVRWLIRRPPSVITLHLGYKPAMAPADGVIRIAKWQDVSAYRGGVVTARNWRTASAPVSRDKAMALRASVGAGEAVTLIGCAVRLHPVKNVDVLIDAFRTVPDARAVLAILSDGPERATLEARAAGDPRIRFLGMRADVDVWYAAFDIFVQPSSSEHSPLTLLEAMDAGLPIAAAANNGSAEMLAGQPARLFTPGDTAALAAILKDWTETPPPRVSYDLSAFDPDRAATAIEGFYRDVIAARASGAGRRKAG